MSTITTKDGTQLYYKDWGKGPVVTFSHGWPLNADAWDSQMLFLAQNGFRVVAHDRRGHGRSSQAWSGNDMDGYADDLAAVIEALDLRDVTLVGHSTGGGEVARYIARHGTKRVARAVLLAAVPPLMLKTAANPEGLPLEVFDQLRSGLVKDRSQFYKDLAIPFYGANRPGAKVSQGLLDQFWLWSMQAGLKNAYDSIKAFSETDQTEDLKKFDVPTLVLHGEDDQIVPVKDSAKKSARLIRGAKEIYYPGAPHGLTATHQDQVNADLLAFLRASGKERTMNRSDGTEADLVTLPSAHGVTETIERLKSLLAQKGIRVFADIDHAAGAKSVGLPLRPNRVVIFGKPQAGTPLMQSRPTIGLDVPLRVLAWEDEAGKVWLTYRRPEFLAQRHQILDRDESVKALGAGLAALARAATSRLLRRCGFRPAARHLDQVRLHDLPRLGHLRPLDDDTVARLQAFRDHGEAIVLLAPFHAAADHLVPFVDQVKDVLQRRLEPFFLARTLDQQGRVRGADR
jgi:non-heme chloroperoxidase